MLFLRQLTFRRFLINNLKTNCRIQCGLHFFFIFPPKLYFLRKPLTKLIHFLNQIFCQKDFLPKNLSLETTAAFEEAHFLLKILIEKIFLSKNRYIKNRQVVKSLFSTCTVLRTFLISNCYVCYFLYASSFSSRKYRMKALKCFLDCSKAKHVKFMHL